MISLAQQAISQLGSVTNNKRKPNPAPVKVFMTKHKKLIADMIRNGATTTIISNTFGLAPTCVRKHLYSVCGADVKAICKVNGELASAKSYLGSKSGFNRG